MRICNGGQKTERNGKKKKTGWQRGRRHRVFHADHKDGLSCVELAIINNTYNSIQLSTADCWGLKFQDERHSRPSSSRKGAWHSHFLAGADGEARNNEKSCERVCSFHGSEFESRLERETAAAVQIFSAQTDVILGKREGYGSAFVAEKKLLNPNSDTITAAANTEGAIHLLK